MKLQQKKHKWSEKRNSDVCITLLLEVPPKLEYPTTVPSERQALTPGPHLSSGRLPHICSESVLPSSNLQGGIFCHVIILMVG